MNKIKQFKWEMRMFGFILMIIGLVIFIFGVIFFLDGYHKNREAKEIVNQNTKVEGTISTVHWDEYMPDKTTGDNEYIIEFQWNNEVRYGQAINKNLFYVDDVVPIYIRSDFSKNYDMVVIDNGYIKVGSKGVDLGIWYLFGGAMLVFLSIRIFMKEKDSINQKKIEFEFEEARKRNQAKLEQEIDEKSNYAKRDS